MGINLVPGRRRRIYFLDTPDLALYRHGVIVRFRERGRQRDDAVVKLRPVVPDRMPAWLRATNRFNVEIDAMPGEALCSGALKNRLRRDDVRQALASGRSLTTLLSSRQRKLLATYAPSRLRLGDLVVFGPIDVRRYSFKMRGLDRRLTAERWAYPDGSHLLELSTRCSTDKVTAVAEEVSRALAARGVVPAELQQTKTERALVA